MLFLYIVVEQNGGLLKCELIGGGLRHLHIFYLFCCFPLHMYQHMLCVAAIVGCTYVGSATASFKVLVTLY